MKRIETEKKYYCDDSNGIVKIALLLGFKQISKDNEIDEYFTDIEGNFIANRTCLRIRRTNNEKIEITYKGKSLLLSNLYSKTETNINAYIDEYDDYIKLFDSLGYYSYVIVDKKRITYSYKNDRYEYNIMIDSVKDIGNFVEFEILSFNEKNNEVLTNELNRFINKFNKLNLLEVDKPYRDIVANTIYENINTFISNKRMYIDLDSLIADEKSNIEYLKIIDKLVDQFNYKVIILSKKYYEDIKEVIENLKINLVKKLDQQKVLKLNNVKQLINTMLISAYNKKNEKK